MDKAEEKLLHAESLKHQIESNLKELSLLIGNEQVKDLIAETLWGSSLIKESEHSGFCRGLTSHAETVKQY